MLNELISQGLFIESDPSAIIPTLSLTDRQAQTIVHDDDDDR